MLQRSRTRVSAERPVKEGELILRFGLQRSRTRVSAERGPAAFSRGSCASAPTEPHSCECGEPTPGEYSTHPQHASTEPHSCECGEAGEGGRADPALRASTEPHSCECGEGSSGFLARLMRKRSNGAALV